MNDENQIHLEANLATDELERLAELSQAPWLSFWEAGGRIAAAAPCPGEYSVGSLLVEGAKNVLLCVEAKDLPDGDELFRISAQEDTHFGEPSYEAKFTPRRAKLLTFPSDLDLSLFLNTQLSIQVLRQETRRPAPQSSRQLVSSLDWGMLVTTSAEHKLLIRPDERIIMNLRLTMSQKVIDDSLAQCRVLRV